MDDPRIGTTAIRGGTIVAKARAYQLVASKTVAKTELRLTLAHVTTAQQLGRISNDTGLQEDEGPGIVKSLTFTVRHNFPHGFVQGLFSKADARDRLTGLPTPEAPRQIWDILATVDKLPFHLLARGQYEEVGRKPLGDGFAAVPVREFHGAMIRPFPIERLRHRSQCVHSQRIRRPNVGDAGSSRRRRAIRAHHWVSAKVLRERFFYLLFPPSLVALLLFAP